ncbi:MAG TPA: hypothetical protein VG347_05325 [Verrucomicrobiae bacterium]|nr:hypothetical protein [Verrucomicrobiae bacterium]
MKAIMILGANVGFVLGMSASILGECTWSTALGHAGIAALVGGVLGRWWGGMWFNELQSAHEQRRRERNAALESKTPVKA